MSRPTDLIAKVKQRDVQLGEDLAREFRVLSARRSFGLNFERHQPEAVELYQRPIRRGDKVRRLTERGSTARGDQSLWQVLAVTDTAGSQRATLQSLDSADKEIRDSALDDRSEEHTSELQSLMRTSYAVFCLKK